MIEGYGIKLTFFVPTWCAEEHPRAVERMLEGGHEVGNHGYLHEQPALQGSRDREIVELPTHWSLDDWPQYVTTPTSTS